MNNLNNIDDFVKTVVHLQKQDGGDYGHYPFQLMAEDKKGDLEVASLALGGDIKACIEKFSEYGKAGFTRIYMSADFSAGGDMKSDFIAIFEYDSIEVKLFAIPYDAKTGEMFERVKDTDSTHLEQLKYNFMFDLVKSIGLVVDENGASSINVGIPEMMNGDISPNFAIKESIKSMDRSLDILIGKIENLSVIDAQLMVTGLGMIKSQVGILREMVRKLK